MDGKKWLSSVAIAFVLTAPASNVNAQTELKPGEVSSSVRNDTSPPLRTLLEDRSLGRATANDEAPTVVPSYNVDRRLLLKEADLTVVDPVVQDYFGLSPMPEPELSFDGIPNVNGALPPDTCGAVGADHYVQVVNLSTAIWDKEGNLLKGPFPSNTLFKGFGGMCESHNDGDPVVHYDKLAGRWLYSQFALAFPNDFSQCIAISTTSDPTGEWHRYEFKMTTRKMNDYPKFGVWPDAYYMAINQFDGASLSWAGQGTWVFEREKMLQGLPADNFPIDLYDVDHYLGAMLPSDLDGLTPPPEGTPNYFITFEDNGWGYPYDRLNIWEFKVDWSNIGSSTLKKLKYLATKNFDSNMCGYSRNCIPQPNTARKLDVISDRLMYRLAYRNFGDHQSLVVNHTVDANGRDHAGIRWYELRDNNDDQGWVINQQGTYAPDSDHRWMGSIAMDGQGNMALGYAVSSSSTYPSVRYAGRLASDPPGELPQSEQSIVEGGGSQTHSSSRFGDYSAMTVDPVDDCTFWYTQEYYANTSPGGWRTRIGSFRFPSCTGEPTGTLKGGVLDQNGNPLQGASVTAGAYTSIADGSGAYKFLDLPAGSYSVAASAYEHSSSGPEIVVIENNQEVTLDFMLSKLALVPVAGTVTDGSGMGWPLYARIDISGYPESPIFTNPENGEFEVMLPEQSVYSFNVSSVTGGYNNESRSVNVLPEGNAENFELEIGQSCNAPGYEMTGGLFEDFNDAGQPVGWKVIDNIGNGEVWRFDDPKHRNNLTGGDGAFVVLDSDFYGPDGHQDAELWTSPMDFSELTEITIEFDTDFNAHASTEVADVDISVDAGATWSNVWRKTGGSYLGPNHENIDVSSLAAGRSDVIVRFHFYEVAAGWWWQIDNISIGSVSCNDLQGALVVGNITDKNTSAPLNGVKVEVVGQNKEIISTVYSVATPEDSAVEDGFYVAFSPAASDYLESKKKGYGLTRIDVPQSVGQVAVLDFEMSAAKISLTNKDTAEDVTDVGLSATLYPGGTLKQTVVVSNSGDLNAILELKEIYAPVVKSQPIGLFAEHGRRVSPKHLNDSDASGVRYYAPPEAAVVFGGDYIASWSTQLDSAWGLGVDIDLDELWLANSSAEGGDKKNYHFDLNKYSVPIQTGETIDASSWAEVFAADMAYDPMSGMLWQVNVGGDNCIYQLDPKNRESTGEKICPAFGTSQRGLAFDWKTETFYSGSWNDAVIYHFDATGTILDSKVVGLNTSGLAFNPTTGHLFVLASASEGLDVYILDVENYYTVVGGYHIEGLDDYDQAGLDIDCEGRLWAVDKNDQLIILAESGEEMTCGWKEDAIPWLSESPEFGSVSKRLQGKNGTLEIIFTFDASNMAVGTYEGQVKVKNDSPYGTETIPVALNVLKMHTITADAGENGVITPEGVVEVKDGAIQSFIITPDEGFHVEDVLVDGDSIGRWESYTFKNVTADHTIVATFSDAYIITAASGNGGAVSPEGEVAVSPGADATFEILPEQGYSIVNVVVDGQSMGAVDSYTFENVTDEHEIHAAFTLVTHVITSSASENGVISPLGSSNVIHGSSATYTISAAEGHHILDVLVDGESVGDVSAYAFKSVSEDHTIHASFEVSSFVVTPEPTVNGAITPSEPVTVQYGESTTFTFQPDEGYQILAVQVDDEFVGNADSYTFTKVNANHTITAFFVEEEAKIFQIEVTVGEGGIVTPSGTVGVEEGSDKSFKITPYSGYHISNVEVDGISEGALQNRIFSNISQNHKLKAIFAQSSYTITAVAHENGQISPSGELIVLSGTDKVFNITPDAGFQIDNVLVDDVSVGAVDDYTVESIKSDHKIDAFFKPMTYAITASKEGNGNISPIGEVEVEHGTSQTFEITPMAYHEIRDVLLDGESVGAVSQYTIENITKKHTIKAIFDTKNHLITATISGQLERTDMGALEPFGQVKVPHGSSETFFIIPNKPEGCYLSGVKIDGTAAEELKNSYEFTDVAEAHAIDVSFKCGEYSITPTSGGHGATSPSSPAKVKHGQSFTVDVIPEEGYTIKDVLVDNESVGPVEEYTFLNVTQNHTLHALFLGQTHTITVIVKMGDIELDKGFIDPIGEKEVEHGGNLTLKMTAGHPKFFVDEIWLDGAPHPDGVTKQYELLNVVEDHLFEVYLKDVVIEDDGSGSTSAGCFINSLFQSGSE